MEPRQQTFYNKNAISVREIGYQEDKNFPSRQNMEDGTLYITQKKSFSITSQGTVLASLQSSTGMEVVRSANIVLMSSLMYARNHLDFLRVDHQEQK